MFRRRVGAEARIKETRKGIKVMRAQSGRWWGKELGLPGVPTLCVVEAALGCMPTGMPSLIVCRGRHKTNGPGGLAVPTAIPSDFPMCFACPPRLAVTFTASGHTGNELRQKAGCGHIVKIPCPSRARRPRWAPELHPALASVLLQSL